MTKWKTMSTDLDDPNDVEIVEVNIANEGYDYHDDDYLQDVCYKVVDYWLEDYLFEELLEEFDLTPQETFFKLVQSGAIDEDRLEDYLNA